MRSLQSPKFFQMQELLEEQGFCTLEEVLNFNIPISNMLILANTYFDRTFCTPFLGSRVSIR